MVIDSGALLRERGIQVTAQRLAVMRAVSGQPHITADAVAEVVSEDEDNIGRSGEENRLKDEAR